MNYIINPKTQQTWPLLARAQADVVPTSRKPHPKGEGVTDLHSHPELTKESVRAAGHRWKHLGGLGVAVRDWGSKLEGAGRRGECCCRSQEADSGSGVLQMLAGRHTHTKQDAKVTNHASHR